MTFLAGLFLLVSFRPGPSSEFMLTGRDLPEELEGTYLYLTLDGVREDSLLIEDGMFAYSSLQADTTHLWVVESPEGHFRLPLIRERGRFILSRSVDERYFIAAADGDSTNLNTTLHNLSREMSSVRVPFSEQNEILSQQLTREDLAEEERGRLEADLASLQRKFLSDSNAIAQRYYDRNRDNIIGILALERYRFASDNDFRSAYEAASDVVKSDLRLKVRYDTILVALETAPGKPYRGDYSIEDGEGTSAMLSDYMKEGKYLLVDFWSSGCHYCRAAMPFLAEIRKYHADEVTILSVGVLEASREDNDHAKQELGITWDTLFDKYSRSVEEYGIDGVPTLLLVDPEGTILYKGSDPEEVGAMIERLLSDVQMGSHDGLTPQGSLLTAAHSA